jgi:hypothetical protein
MSASATEASKAWSDGVAGDIVRILWECAGVVDCIGPSEWRLIGDDASAIRVRIENGWLVLRKPIPSRVDGADVRPWEVLSPNAELSGSVKRSLVPSERVVELGAEIPLDGDVDVRVRQACRLMRGKETARFEDDATETSAKSGDASADLEQVCADAGWPFTTRPDGSLAVELRAPDAYGVARVEGRANGAVRVSIDVVNEGDAPSPVCQAALAALMVGVNDVVRFVRVVAPPSEDKTNFRIEVVFVTPPSATELDHALAALSVAWGMCSSETEVLLRDEVVARAYLERSPWSLVPGP